MKRGVLVNTEVKKWRFQKFKSKKYEYEIAIH